MEVPKGFDLEILSPFETFHNEPQSGELAWSKTDDLRLEGGEMLLQG